MKEWSNSVSDFTVVTLPKRRTAVARATLRTADLAEFFGRALPLVLSAMEAQGTLPAGEPFAYYRRIHAENVEVETGFPILGRFVASGEIEPGQLPACTAISSVHVGALHTRPGTYARMVNWAVNNGLKPTGEMWEVHLVDPDREADPSRWLTELFLPVE